MAGTDWYCAPGGQQQGPYSETQLRSLIAGGTVGPDTLVWTDGMADWQPARAVAGLFPNAPGRPPSVPRQAATGAAPRAERLSIDFGILALVGRGLLFLIGFLLVIPAPWAATGFYRWMVSRIDVPGRPNLSFTGQPMDIWWVFVLMALCTWAPALDVPYLGVLLIPVQGFLSWMTVRWIVSRLASNGEPLPMAFAGSAVGYVGWNILLYVSVITIVGWAWVTRFWTQWICRHVEGTRRPIFFNGSGLQILWRTLVFALVSILIIPIPWITRWYARWFVSQISLGRPETP